VAKKGYSRLESEIDAKNPEIYKRLRLFEHEKGKSGVREKSKNSQPSKPSIVQMEQIDDLYSNKDIYEEDDSSVSSIFDTFYFVCSVFTFLIIVVLVSVANK